MYLKRLYILVLLFMPSMLMAQLTLDDCLQMAQTNNLLMQQTNLEVEKAKEVKRQAFTHYFPQVSIQALGYQSLRPMLEFGIEDVDNSGLRDMLNTLYGNYGAALGLDSHISLLQHGVVAGVTAVQPLYAGGQIVAGNRLAKVGIEAARLEQSVASRDALWQVEECFWTVVQLEQKRATIEAADTLLKTLEKDVNVAVEAGLVMPTDRLRLQMKQHQLQAQKQELESGIKLAREALAQTIGISADSIGELLYEDLLQDEFVPLAGENRRTEEELLQLQVDAKRLERRMQLGKSLPQMAVGAGYGYSNLFDKHSTNGTLFLTLQIPISGWGETAHKMKELDYDISIAQLKQNDLTQKMRLQEKQMRDKVEVAKNKVQTDQQALGLAEENYRLSAAAYDAGLQPISELLQAQTEWQQAQNELIDAQIQYHLLYRHYQMIISSNN